jgi:hypothetical protein
MESSPAESLAKKEVATDLKAAVQARRELGGDLEEHVLEAFLARVQERIDAQVRQQLQGSGSHPVARGHKGAVRGWVLPTSLAMCIPLVAIAGASGGAVGIVVVLGAVLGLFAIFLEYANR